MFFLLLSAGISFAQNDTLYFIPTTKNIRIDSSVVKFHSFSVYPYHFSVSDTSGKIYPDTLYRVDFVKALLYWKDSIKEPFEVQLRFYQYPRQWVDTIPHFEVFQSGKNLPPLPSTDRRPAATVFDDLNVDGFFERGISGGNHQDVTGPSRLDLKMDGKLAPDIFIKARISDDNLPDAYQGVTTSFKEANRIFLEINGPGWTVEGGDKTWHFDHSLLPIRRENKGIGIKWHREDIKVNSNIAIAKGKFHSVKFILRSGNYGPFRLTGPEGELYIFIVPRSEKVYLNGKLLKRGEDADYIMDYGKAEIKLNPTLSIKDYDRLWVEFLYANQHYQRWSSFHSVAQNINSKHHLNFFFFNETDIKTRPLLFSPDSMSIHLLSQNPSGEVQTVLAQETSWDDTKILYQKIISGSDFHFEYVPTEPVSNTTLYDVKFEYVGKGNGMYIIDKYLAEGRVMKYVGPGNGDYSHYIRIKAPSSSLYTGMEYAMNTTKWEGHITGIWNRFNPNMFYSPHNPVNIFAWDGKWSYYLLRDSLKSWNLSARYRHKPALYHATGNLFPADFTDRWPITNPNTGMHRLGEVQTSYQTEKSNYNLSLSELILQDSIRLKRILVSHQTGINQSISWKGLHFLSGGQTGQKAGIRFEHSEMEWMRGKGKWQPAAGYLYEKKLFTTADTLSPGSFSYTDLHASLLYKKSTWQTRITAGRLTADSLKNRKLQNVYKLFYARNEWQINRNNTQASFGGEWQHAVIHPDLAKQKIFLDFSDNRPAKGQSIRLGFSLYGSQTPKQEVIYRRVPDGQGQYQWTDYNGNGEQEPEEFEPAYYPDQAQYIRVWLPSQHYIPTYTTQWQAHWTIQTKKWKAKPFFRAWTNRLNYRFENQSQGNLKIPTFFQLNELSLQGFQTLTENISYQPSGKRFKATYTLQISERINRLFNGKQSAFQRRHLWVFSYNLTDTWQAVTEIFNAAQSYRSEDYAAKNYGYIAHGTKIKLNRKTRNISWSNALIYAVKDNQQGIFLEQKELRITLRFFQNPNNFMLETRFIDNRFNGNPLTPIGFNMLEGLKPGQNFILHLKWNKQLREDLVLQTFYLLRTARGTLPVHSFQISMKAVF